MVPGYGLRAHAIEVPVVDAAGSHVHLGLVHGYPSGLVDCAGQWWPLGEFTRLGLVAPLASEVGAWPLTVELANRFIMMNETAYRRVGWRKGRRGA